MIVANASGGLSSGGIPVCGVSGGETEGLGPYAVNRGFQRFGGVGGQVFMSSRWVSSQKRSKEVLFTSLKKYFLLYYRREEESTFYFTTEVKLCYLIQNCLTVKWKVVQNRWVPTVGWASRMAYNGLSGVPLWGYPLKMALGLSWDDSGEMVKILQPVQSFHFIPASGVTPVPAGRRARGPAERPPEGTAFPKPPAGHRRYGQQARRHGWGGDVQGVGFGVGTG